MNPDSATDTGGMSTLAVTPVWPADPLLAAPPSPPAPRQRRVWPPARVLAAMLLMLLAALTFAALAALDHLNAQSDYVSAVAARNDAADELTAAYDRLSRAAEGGATTLSAATDTVAVAADGFVGAAEKAALAEAGAALAAAIESGEGHLGSPPDIRPLPDSLWTVPQWRAETALLHEEITAFTDDASEQTTIAGQIADAETATADAGTALVLSVAPLADALKAQYPSATNHVYNDFSNTADRVSRLDGSWSDKVPRVLADYLEAAGELRQSHADEEAEKAGPLYAKRVAVEEYARSIAGGVRLDFDWAEIVNGHGANDNRYSGTATWNLDNGGYSTIALSNNIATYWNLDRATTRALVTHEVGHSITSKCYPLFTRSFDADDEVWATAWAIGMGHDNDGSGTGIYGRPSNELIELSKECR